MAKVQRTVGPTVGAPDLTRNLQNINIPKDAFGANVDKALADLGGTVADSANKINLALGRQAERRSITEASVAFKDVPIREFNALEEAKKNPGDLATFQERQTAEFDKRMNALRQGLSERARLKFDEKTLSTRTSLAKNATTWARGQEILQGRNAMNSEIQNSIAVAPGDLLNLGQHRQDVINAVNQAHASGSLIDGRGKPIDPVAMIKSKLRQMDKEIANSLVFNQPEILEEMLNGKVLNNLSEKDEKEFRNSIESSKKNIIERRRTTALDAYLEQNVEFAKKLHDGLLHGPEGWNEINNEMESLQPLVDAGDNDAKLQQITLEIMRDRLEEPEEVKQEEATQARIRQITATKEAKEALGILTGEKPTAAQKGRATVWFANRFTDLVKKRQQGKNRGQFKLKDPSTRLSEVLNFQRDIENALDLELIDRSDHEMWMTKLLPVVRQKIESKHFQERRGLFVTDRDPDIYSDAFDHVLETLEGTEFDTPENQAAAVLFAFQIAEETDPNKEEDILKRKDLIQQFGGRALNALYRQLIPEINNLTDDQMPDVVPVLRGDEPITRKEFDAQGNAAMVTRDKDGKVISFEEIP